MINSEKPYADTPPDAGRRFSALTLTLAVVAALAIGVAAALLFSRARVDPSQQIAEEAHANEPPPGIVEIPAAAQQSASIQTAPVADSTLPATVQATGVVAVDESRVAHIRPLARGVVEKVYVSLGARVKAGEPLLELDNIELGELIGGYLSERAGLQQSQTDLEVRRRSLDRARELIRIEAISQQMLDQREAEFKNAEAAVTSQRAKLAKVEEQIHRFGLTDADLAKLTSGDTTTAHRVASHNTLRAPFTGIVTHYSVASGEAVAPDSELLTVADISTVWILADVYEKDLAKLQPTNDVRLQLEAFPDQTFTGRLTYISDLIDPKTRAAKVRIVVPNPDGVLRLEMFARATIPTKDRRQGLSVPTSALQHVDNQPVVFVRQSDTRFERRDVRVGMTTDSLVEILSGVKAGETVVTVGSFYLKTNLLRERIGDEH